MSTFSNPARLKLLVFALSACLFILQSCDRITAPPPFENPHDPQAAGFVADAPTHVSVSQISGKDISISWHDSSTHAKGFVIERSSGGGSFIELGSVPRDSLHFTDTTGVEVGVSYVYRVGTVGDNGRTGYSIPVPFSFLFPPPFNLYASGRGTYIDFYWQDTTSTNIGFVIEKSVDSVNYEQFARISEDSARLQPNLLTFKYTPTDTNHIWYYRVRGYTKYVESAPTQPVKLEYVPYPGYQITSIGSGVLDFVYNPSGSVVAAAWYNGSWGAVNLYDADSYTLIRSLAVSLNRPKSIAFSPDGTFLAVAYADSIKILNSQSGALYHVIPVSVQKVLYSPDGAYLAGAGLDSTYLWDVKTWDVAEAFEGGVDVAFTADGSMLADAVPENGNYYVDFWNVGSGTFLNEVDVPHKGSISFVMDPSAGRLVSIGDDAFHVIQVPDGRDILTTTWQAGKLASEAISSNGDFFSVIGSEGPCEIYMMASLKEVTQVYLGPYSDGATVRFSPKGSAIAACEGGQINFLHLYYSWKLID